MASLPAENRAGIGLRRALVGDWLADVGLAYNMLGWPRVVDGGVDEVPYSGVFNPVAQA